MAGVSHDLPGDRRAGSAQSLEPCRHLHLVGAALGDGALGTSPAEECTATGAAGEDREPLPATLARVLGPRPTPLRSTSSPEGAPVPPAPRSLHPGRGGRVSGGVPNTRGAAGPRERGHGGHVAGRRPSATHMRDQGTWGAHHAGTRQVSKPGPLATRRLPPEHPPRPRPGSGVPGSL